MPEREDQRTRDDDLGDLDDVGGGGLDGDVGLDQDPSEQYGDLVDGGSGGLAGGDETETVEAPAEDDGGFLGGFFGSDDLAESETTAEDDGGLFSARAFLAILVGCGALAGVGGTLVPFVGGLVGPPAGLFLGAFLAGLIGSRRRYAEAAVTGAVLGVLSVLFGGYQGLAIMSDASLTVVGGVGAVVGLLVGVLGLYFGRDLRAGLTADIDG